MTRTLTTPMAASVGLEAGQTIVHFLEFAFGGGTLRITTAPVDLSWNGFTWSAVGGHLTFEPITEAAGDERSQGVRLELSAVNQSFLATVLQQQYIGRYVRVWHAHVTIGANLLDNSGFESDTNGVVATGATLSRVATPTWEGQYALAVAMTVSAADQGVTGFDLKGGSWPPVVAGLPYVFTLRAQMGAGSGARQLKAEMDFYTATSGSYLGSATADSKTLGVGFGWTEYEVSGVAPATATVCRLRFRSVSGTGLYTVYVDGLHLTPGTRQIAYAPTDGAAVAGGTVLSTPVPMGVYFMNGGFELDESVTAEQATCTISCRVVSRLAELTNRRGIKTNVQSHQAVFLGDLFFFDTPNIANRQITWGGLTSAGQYAQNKGLFGGPPRP